ncbi:MAG: hypothetical protein JNG89_21640 [Planctomycetaceae bacterium]|nr:hypothetical protein [Planctomycetaceae bacterium]
MDAPFPFGFPFNTAVYLTLLVGTWVLHVVFMHYVLGGTAYLAVRTVCLGNRAETSTTATLLREWLPFVLSAAITAGIAPLLFAQVAYQHRFYTANLLLFYRWLAILPALLFAFYLLYLLKSQSTILHRAVFRITSKVIVCACCLYVAWLWTTNHLLSVQSMETWTRQYAAGTVMYRTAEILPRLALWVVSAFPTLAAWLAWQLWFNLDGGPELLSDVERETSAADVRHVALLGLCGLVLTCVLAAVYALQLPAADRTAFTGPLARIYLGAMCAGVAAQFAMWLMLWRRPQLNRTKLFIMSGGLAITLLGLGVLRESLRLTRIVIADLYPAHEAAATVSGRWLFAAVLIVNTALIVCCLRIVQHAREK